MELRLLGAETDQTIIDNFYMPVFKLNSRIGNSSSDELSKSARESQKFGAETSDSSLAIVTTQRLPGGASVGLSLGKEWGRGRSENDVVGDTSHRNDQYSYQVEARQPLLRGAGAAASVELNIGKLGLAQARLNHQIFLQDDLLKTVTVYSELLSGRQNVTQAERSLQMSKDFLAATQAQVGQGMLAKSEMDQAQFAVSQGELELAYAQQAEKDAIDQLLAFSSLAIYDDQNLRPFPEVDIDSAATAKFPESIAEIEVAKLNLQIAKQQRIAAKDQGAIEVNAVVSAGKGWGNRFSASDHERRRDSGWRSQSYIGLEMTKTLNDYSARASQRKSRLAVEEKQLELQEAQLLLDVRRAGVKRGFSSAQRYLQLIKKKIEVASKNVANERFKIEAGRSNAFMVYSAQNSLAQAQSEHIDATSRYIVAAAQLYKEQGKLTAFVDELSFVDCSPRLLGKSPHDLARD